jgi:hypothetical protein
MEEDRHQERLYQADLAKLAQFEYLMLAEMLRYFY